MELSKSYTVYEGNRYHVKAVWTMEANDTGTYVVVNNNTGIFEMESSILPQAITYCHQLDGHLDELHPDEVSAPKLN